MRYCSNCGKEVDEKAYVCPNCGALLQGEPAPQQRETPEKKKAYGFAITGLVLGILSVFFGVYYCILPAVGLVFSILAMRKKTYGGAIAITALVLNCLFLVIWGFVWFIVLCVHTDFLWFPIKHLF